MSLKAHGVHTDIHRLYFHAGGLADHIAHFAHNGAADRHQIHSVFHDDVQFDGDGTALPVTAVNTSLLMRISPKSFCSFIGWIPSFR